MGVGFLARAGRAVLAATVRAVQRARLNAALAVAVPNLDAVADAQKKKEPFVRRLVAKLAARFKPLNAARVHLPLFVGLRLFAHLVVYRGVAPQLARLLQTITTNVSTLSNSTKFFPPIMGFAPRQTLPQRLYAPIKQFCVFSAARPAVLYPFLPKVRRLMVTTVRFRRTFGQMRDGVSCLAQQAVFSARCDGPEQVARSAFFKSPTGLRAVVAAVLE